MIYNPVESVRWNLSKNLRTVQFYLNRLIMSVTSPNQLDNIFFCSTQKAGSQWIFAIFSDKRIQKLTGLPVYPQHHYDINDFRTQFPKRAFIPGLYVDYNLYEKFIGKPKKYKTFYIYRDPRNLIVSFYWSAKETHGLNDGLDVVRQRLNSMSQDDGLLYAINCYVCKLAVIRSWIELGSEDPNVMLLKFEDLVARPDDTLLGLFDFLGHHHNDRLIIKSVISDYSRENMRIKDLKAREEGEESHYRKKPSNYLTMFKPVHYEALAKVSGDLIERLGYESSPSST